MFYDCMGNEVKVNDVVAYATSSSRNGAYIQLYRVDEIVKLHLHGDSFISVRSLSVDKNGVKRETNNLIHQDVAKNRLVLVKE